MSDILMYIWIGISITIALGGIFAAGFTKNQCSDDPMEVISGSLAIAAFWPLALILAIGVLPFWCLYKLGEILGNKRKA